MKPDRSVDDRWEDPSLWRDRFSVGGLKYVLDSRGRLERAFWVVFVTAGTVVVSLLLYSTVKAFVDDPVSSTLVMTFFFHNFAFIWFFGRQG